jgi:hypothetical protein
MKRKLSAVEQMIDANIVYMVRLEGGFSVDQLRSALSRCSESILRYVL